VRAVFFGTPDVAVPSLEILDDAADVEVVAVVTNPDRPRGRSRTPVASPVKEAALRRDLRVLQPERPAEIVTDLERIAPDVGAVVAYGAILAPEVLETARIGLVNLHFSLLPRWRGAAPVQHAILAGDRTTGLTTFVLDAGMDTGPILDQVERDIGPDETAGEVLTRLAQDGAGLLLESLRRLSDGAEPVPQSTDGVTLAPKITSDQVAIDWTRPAGEVVNLVRAANPAPGAHTAFGDTRLKVWRAATVDASGTPGDQHLLSIHIWSRTGSPGELEELLRAAEQAIISGGNDLNPRREFSEIRYDDEQGAYHGLLRMKLLCGQGTSDEPADE
jgi:methionyl-tRNA formyltransferase